MQLVRMDCSCLQTAGESSVSRRLCHANCLNEGLAFDGRNSSKAPISRSSFSLFSDQSGGICLILCRSSLQVPQVVVRLARGFGNWMRMPFLDLRVMLGNGSIHSGNQPQAEPTSKRGQQQCRFHHRKASTDANPRARTYNLLDIATIVGARRYE